MAKKKKRKQPSRSKKKSSCGAAPSLPESLPSLQSMESILSALGGGRRGKRNAVDEAQEIMYDAWESQSEKEAVALAQKALSVSADCADAYNLLAESARCLEEATRLYRCGVEAGERALGKKAFKDDVGHFWGILETRPYMRARERLADCLWKLGRREEAIHHYRDMLRLNPNDNQGVRYRLLLWFLYGGDVEGAVDLLGKYEEEWTATWLYTRALAVFLREGSSTAARHALQEALEQNHHVVPYLMGRRQLPKRLPKYVVIGDRSQAVGYVAEFNDVWARTPGALSWVASAVYGEP